MLDTIFTYATKILDLLILWLIIYKLFKYARNNFKLTLILKGIIIIAVLKFVSDKIHLKTVGIILEYVISWGPLAVIIIFQPEIRNVLESIGRSQLLGRHKTLTVDEREKLVYEIINAVEYLKKNRIGALIVLERDYSLAQYIEPANKLYADISSELLISIFFPNNPLHDGGVIIQGDKITCAGSVFPTSMNPSISKRLGTRHRAALGISESTDAIAIVVSEETGRISIAVGGTLNYNLSLDDAKILLLEELQPKKETFYEADTEAESESDKDEKTTN
ncbi:MAG: diadenylate cyclase CdaA [Clostridium sp.]|jgi:diadenylate cyclase|nr:diadenylate cyclase CdaA [Clostridium sp.]